MTWLLLTLLACDPNEDVKLAEAPYYSASGIEAVTGAKLAPIESGQPLGQLEMRLVITDEGMHIDNRGWFLQLDHTAVLEARGEGRVKNLIYDEAVDIRLDDGNVPEGDLRGEEIRELGRYLARMQNKRTRLGRALDPGRSLQIYADEGVPALTLNRAMFTARRAAYDPITVVGTVDDTPRAAIVARPAPYEEMPCAVDLQIAPHEGGWVVAGRGTPALRTGDSCGMTAPEVAGLLRSVADACKQRWPTWHTVGQTQTELTIDPLSWQCIGARPRMQGDATVGDVLELHGLGFDLFPDVVMMETGGLVPDVETACNHHVAVDSLTDEQLDAVCGIDWIPRRLQMQGSGEVTPAQLARVVAAPGVQTRTAFPEVNNELDQKAAMRRMLQLRDINGLKPDGGSRDAAEEPSAPEEAP